MMTSTSGARNDRKPRGRTIALSMLLLSGCFALAVVAANGGSTERPRSDEKQAGRAEREPWVISENLIPNGGFEQGDAHPAGWQGLDGLSTFWVDGGHDSRKCIMIDTDVLLKQWRQRQEQVAEDPGSPAPAKIPTKPPKYDTVAGNDGVHYKCDHKVPFKEGAVYMMCIDAKTTARGEPFMWCRGYLTHRNRERMIGQARLNMYKAGPEWKTHRFVFHPTKWKSTINAKPARPEYFKLVIYAYWPPGKYWFDNVRLVMVDESKLPEELREDPKQPGPRRKARTAPHSR